MEKKPQKKPLIKGRKLVTDSGLKSGRRKIGKSIKKEEEAKTKGNPLLSQPPASSSTFKWFLKQNELHKKAAPKEDKKSKKIDQLNDEDFFKKNSTRFSDRFTSR